MGKRAGSRVDVQGRSRHARTAGSDFRYALILLLALVLTGISIPRLLERHSRTANSPLAVLPAMIHALQSSPGSRASLCAGTGAGVTSGEDRLY